ncbi:MAG: SRPBCC family protein [Leptospiraceae bacterium]|nr:SRPBCC family protein [Leptospiraceae bacterium]
MKSFLKWFGLGFAGLIAILVLVGFLLPSSYRISRSIEIQKSVDEVFPLVNNLKNQQKWSPWREMDPDMKIEWGSVLEGKGAKYSWTGPKSGEGSMEITESIQNEKIVTALDFGQQGQATADFLFEPTGDNSVKVTWGFDGSPGMDLVGRYFGLIMESMLGPDYEKGLSHLKKLAETGEAANQVD